MEFFANQDEARKHTKLLVATAAGVSVLKVYVLDDEKGINAIADDTLLSRIFNVLPVRMV